SCRRKPINLSHSKGVCDAPSTDHRGNPSQRENRPILYCSRIERSRHPWNKRRALAARSGSPATPTPLDSSEKLPDNGRMASKLRSRHRGGPGRRSSLYGRDSERTQCTRGPRLSGQLLDHAQITRHPQKDAKLQDRLHTRRRCSSNGARKGKESQAFKGRAYSEINFVSPSPETVAEVQKSAQPEADLKRDCPREEPRWRARRAQNRRVLQGNQAAYKLPPVCVGRLVGRF